MSQEKVYKLLAVEGDCWHYWHHSLSGCDIHDGFCVVCKKYSVRINLTTEAGAFWIMKRLPKWERYIIGVRTGFEHYLFTYHGVETPGDLLCFLLEDAKDGKAPALYKALCEFEGIEVDG